MRLLCLLLVVLAVPGCNFGGASTPTFGRWKVTEITGQITYVDSGAACAGNWTFSMPNLASSWNGVKVGVAGDVEYYLSFKGVPGSPAPDGYDTAAPATAKSGDITGNDVRMDLGLVTTAHGTWSATTMNVNWTLEQHLGDASACKTDISGSGTFTATPP